MDHLGAPEIPWTDLALLPRYGGGRVDIRKFLYNRRSDRLIIYLIAVRFTICRATRQHTRYVAAQQAHRWLHALLGNVNWAGGGWTSFFRRERPGLSFDEHGEPTFLPGVGGVGVRRGNYPCLIKALPLPHRPCARACMGRVLHKSGRNSGARKGRRARGAETFSRSARAYWGKSPQIQQNSACTTEENMQNWGMYFQIF